MRKITTSTGATLEFKEKADVMEMIDEAEAERERIATELDIDIDKVQVQHVSMDSFDFSTPDQILKHNTDWKEVKEAKKSNKQQGGNQQGGE